jgi:hypothetical protein
MMGPPRFELELLPPRGRRIPSYPTGPKKAKRRIIKVKTSIFRLFDILYGFQIGKPNGKISFPAMVLSSIPATA